MGSDDQQRGRIAAVVALGSFLRGDDFLEELARELELLRLGGWAEQPVGDRVGGLASFAEALAVCEHLRREARSQVEQGVAAGLDEVTIHVGVPPLTPGQASGYASGLTAAIAACRSGQMLTIPPPPEVVDAHLAWMSPVLDVARRRDPAPAPASRASSPPRAGLEAWAPQTPSEMELPLSSSLPLPCAPDAAAAARHWVQQLLERWDEPELGELAALPLTELVTNAVLHARTPLRVVARLGTSALRVEVEDESHDRAASRTAGDPAAGTGRGLALVDAMAHRWGVEDRGRGKVVWFELQRERARAPDVAQGRGRGAGGARSS